MIKTTSLQTFTKDHFLPQPKKIPKRTTKEITLELEDNNCPFCDQPLQYYYLSNVRPLISLEYDILLRVVHKKCVNEQCIAYLNDRSFHNPSLESYALPKRLFALDIVLLIGYLSTKENQTEQDVVKHLLEEHGIEIAQSSVNGYKRIALALGEALLAGNADKIKKGLDEMPFRVYTLDGLSSNKSRTEFIIRDLFSGTVLGTIILDKHDADTIHHFMERVFSKFGEPDFLVGDGETGLIAAARKNYKHIPYHYCHRHFLNNLGKALMEDLMKTLKKK